MTRGEWKEPVPLKTADFTRCFKISSTAEASRLLLDDWPGQASAARIAAKAICLLVLTGAENPSTARQLFLAAAEDAGFLILREPSPPRCAGFAGSEIVRSLTEACPAISTMISFARRSPPLLARFRQLGPAVALASIRLMCQEEDTEARAVPRLWNYAS